MQIRHKDGSILIDIGSTDRLLSADGNIVIRFNEQEANYLVNADGQSALQQAVNEARAFNRQSKIDEIAKLRLRIRELETTLPPIPPQPRSKI